MKMFLSFTIPPLSPLPFPTRLYPLTLKLDFVKKIENSNNFNNQLEFAASAVYSIKEYFSPSLGFYYTDKNFEDDFFEINSEMNAFFIIAGLNANFSFFDLDLAIADSRLLSGDLRKQTIVKFTLGFYL